MSNDNPEAGPGRSSAAPHATGGAGSGARLAAFATGLRWSDLPEPVRHAARRALLNYCAVALAGSRDRTVDAAVRTFLPLHAGSVARLVGRAERFDPLHALCAFGGGRIAPQPLIDAVWAIDRAPDAAAVFALASPSS